MQFAEIAKSFVVFSAPKPDFGLLVIFKKPDYLGKSKEKKRTPGKVGGSLWSCSLAPSDGDLIGC